MMKGGVRTAGRGRGLKPEHQGVQPRPLLLEAFQGLPERRSLRYSWKYEILDVYKLLERITPTTEQVSAGLHVTTMKFCGDQ